MRNQLFTELLANHRDRIYSHALYTLRDRHDAEDVTQEAFLKLWNRYHEIDPEKISGWLMRVTHNLCIDHVRRRQASNKNFGHPDPDAVATLATGPDDTTDPEHRLDLTQRQQALLTAMQTLSPETRSVMIMHYFQEMKLHEIGATLGKSVSALKVQMHRARKSLRLVLVAAIENPPQAQRGTG